MKFRMLFVAALLAMSSLAFGQAASVILSEFDAALTNNCDGSGGCIPEGTVAEIHLDMAPVGVYGPEDPLATVGSGSTDWNFNTFPINPGDASGCGGYFNFTSWGTNNAQPNPAGPYIVVLRSPSGNALWVSAGRNFGPGPQEWEADGWLCRIVVQECNNQPATVVLAGSAPVCFPTCLGHTTDVTSDCPADRAPLATLDGNPIPTAAWTYSGGMWHYTYVGLTDGGQACFQLLGCSPPPCTASADYSFEAYNSSGGVGWPRRDCLQVCAGSVTNVTVVGQAGAVQDPTKAPIFSVLDGCETCGNPSCTPGHAEVSVAYVGGYWVITLIGTNPGCVCLHFDGFLAAHALDFVATAGDNSISLTFRTASETDVVRFEIDRAVKGHSFEKIASLNSNNSATGADYNYTDANATNGTTYSYRLYSVSANGDRTEELTTEATPSFNAAVITEYALHQNFPNPFNPTTQITFDLVNENFVSLTVYNVSGQVVGTVVNGTMDAGRHTVNFDAGNLTSGLYFYTVKIGNEFTATKKMMLVK